MNIPRIVIKVVGGRVQGTVSDVPCEIMVLDYDVENCTDEELEEMEEYPEHNSEHDPDTAEAYEEAPLVNPSYWPDINKCHFRKATDDCRGFESLCTTLRHRFAAIHDGRAFQ